MIILENPWAKREKSQELDESIDSDDENTNNPIKTEEGCTYKKFYLKIDGAKKLVKSEEPVSIEILTQKAREYIRSMIKPESYIESPDEYYWYMSIGYYRAYDILIVSIDKKSNLYSSRLANMLAQSIS